ncbi:MAG: class I SAM-dependent methyltransferase [Rhodothermales bacterium]
MLPSILATAHARIAEVLSEGDWAVDATLGNGHDTLFLAQHVGKTGRVVGFDVQANALVQSRRRLEAGGVAGPVTLIHAGHETMEAHLPEEQPIQAIMFNLGYLPGSDKSCVTQAATTCTALDAACRVLAVGGRMTVAVYTGHPGGDDEAKAVADFLQGLDQRSFQVARYGFINQRNAPPYLYLIEKLPAR